MEFTGIIRQAMPITQGISQTGKPWKKQQFFIEENNQKEYKDSVVVTVMRQALLEWMAAHVGREVTVSFSPRANLHDGRYYQNLTCWTCTSCGERVGVEKENSSPSPQPVKNDIPF